MDTKARMTITAAARWAERKDCVFINGNYDNPMYAAVDLQDNRVDCLGSFDKCDAYMKAHPEKAMRRYCIDNVLEQIGYAEAESSCYLGQREEGISWEAC